MSLSINEVEHVAELVRIKLADEEKENFSVNLSEIIDYVAELEKAPTENILEINQISGLDNIFREDNIEGGLSIGKILQNAPDKEGNFIKVKKVFE